jgi:hypothetical protein
LYTSSTHEAAVAAAQRRPRIPQTGYANVTRVWDWR